MPHKIGPTHSRISSKLISHSFDTELLVCNQHPLHFIISINVRSISWPLINPSDQVIRKRSRSSPPIMVNKGIHSSIQRTGSIINNPTAKLLHKRPKSMPIIIPEPYAPAITHFVPHTIPNQEPQLHNFQPGPRGIS